MKRTLQLLDQLVDLVIVQARPQTEGAGSYDKGLGGLGLFPGVQAEPQGLVYDFFESPPRAAGFSTQLGSDIFV